MDVNALRVIVDYLLHLPIEDRALHYLMDALSLPKPDPRLMKALILRKINLEIKKRTVSEEMLDCLEALVHSDTRKGIPIMDVMKDAYRAVAVHCTAANCFAGDVFDSERYKDNVARIWGGRIRDMERARGGVALVTDKLKDVGTMIMNSVAHGKVNGDLMRGRDTLGVALQWLEIYYEDAVEEMGSLSMEILEAEETDDGLDGTGLAAPLVACRAGKGKAPVVVVSSDDGSDVGGDHVDESVGPSCAKRVACTLNSQGSAKRRRRG